MNNKHLMIDIETLDTVETSVILSIAAVEFDPMCHGTKKIFYGSASVQRQLDMGRTISADTLQWWLKQDREVMREAFSEITDFKFILHDLELNLQENGIDKNTVIWANSPAFDLNKLKHAYRQLGLEWRYSYTNERDVRTFLNVWPEVNVCWGPGNTRHHALDDCYSQITAVQNMHNSLNNLKKKAQQNSVTS